MRWFIVLLLLANVVLFFWVQQQSRPVPGTGSLPPPEVGRLRLMTEVGDREAAVMQPRDGEGGRDSVPALMPEVLSQGPEASPAETEDAPDLGEPAAPLPAVERAAEVEAQVESESESTPPVEPEEPSEILADDVQQASVAVAVSEDSAAEIGVGPVLLPQPSVSAGVSTDATAGPVAAEPEVDMASPVCARVGPLEPQDADTLVSGLPANIQLISDTSEEYARVDGYYVLIPALPSRAEGIRKLKELEDAGITDIWLFRGGDLNNAISLGLYRSEQGARQHAARVAKKGFACEVRERTSLKERRWLQLRNTQGGDPHGGLPLPAGVQIIPQTCR